LRGDDDGEAVCEPFHLEGNVEAEIADGGLLVAIIRAV
jgi:hypothetical protein